MGFKPLTDAVTAKEFLRRPVVLPRCGRIYRFAAEELDDKIIELIETEIKYEGYLKSNGPSRKKNEAYGRKNEFLRILTGMILTHCNRSASKFKLINPETIGQ